MLSPNSGVVACPAAEKTDVADFFEQQLQQLKQLKQLSKKKTVELTQTNSITTAVNLQKKLATI